MPTPTLVQRAPYLRVLLPHDLRMELGRQAMEQRRSPEAHATFLLEHLLLRAAARRSRRTIDQTPPLATSPKRPV